MIRNLNNLHNQNSVLDIDQLGNNNASQSVSKGINTSQSNSISLNHIASEMVVPSQSSGDTKIIVSRNQMSDSTVVYEYVFQVASPQRFEVAFNVPEDIANACITLNGKLLVGLFAEELPIQAILPDCLPRKCCSDEGPSHETFSTMAPGKVQRLNFKWYDKDILRIFIYSHQ